MSKIIVGTLLASATSAFRHVANEIASLESKEARNEAFMQLGCSQGFIICPVLNALVQNGDMTVAEDNYIDADSVLDTLQRAGLNQPKYEGSELVIGSTQSSAFEYTLGIWGKNAMAGYRDSKGQLRLPICNFTGTNHEHNSRTGITNLPGQPWNSQRWDELARQVDSTGPYGDCFTRNGWRDAMFFFEQRPYNYKPGDANMAINSSKLRLDHPLLTLKIANKLLGNPLRNGAKNGNTAGGKRLVAGVSQVYNGMINLYWTGDYGNVALYKLRALYSKSPAGKQGKGMPWLDPNYCLPLAELKAFMKKGTYPKSSGYRAMSKAEFKANGKKVWKFPISRCKSTYFAAKAGGTGCINGQPPLIKQVSWLKRQAIHQIGG